MEIDVESPIWLTRFSTSGRRDIIGCGAKSEGRNTVLGGLPHAVNTEPTLEVELRWKKRMTLCSEGPLDVFDRRGDTRGLGGLQAVIGEASYLPFSEMKQAIVDRVAAWRKGPAAEDASLVLMEVR